MSTALNDDDRKTFAGIADVLIPAAEGMPAASEIGIQGEILDKVLGFRPDLRENLLRGLRAVKGKAAREAAEFLNKNDGTAFGAISLAASAGYYMDPKVRKLIGYPGQENRPYNADETPEYVRNGMLKAVSDRGPIYKPTPK